MDSHPVPDFAELIARVATALSAQGLPFMVIGGQAVLLHGEPRLTQDIDITLGAAPSRLPELIAVCGSAGLRPLPSDLDAFVRETFVLPAVDDGSGIRVDFIFSVTPYEAQAIARALSVEVHGASVRFATAEDVILHKLFAGRARDLEDAAGIVRRKRSQLDWDYLHRWAAEFATVAGREGMTETLRALAGEPER